LTKKKDRHAERRKVGINQGKDHLGERGRPTKKSKGSIPKKKNISYGKNPLNAQKRPPKNTWDGCSCAGEGGPSGREWSVHFFQ